MIALATIQWNNINIYSAELFSEVDSSNASATDESVTFDAQTAWMKRTRSWELLSDNSNFSTSQLRLNFGIQSPVTLPYRYTGEIMVQLDIWYWVPAQDEYVKTKGQSHILVFSSDAQAPTYSSFIVETDESYIVAQLDITFRYNSQVSSSQTLIGIFLDTAVSEVQRVRDEINQSLARGVLTKLDFYSNGFIATFQGQQLAYKYQVTDNVLTGLIHQPSGTVVTITNNITPMPGG